MTTPRNFLLLAAIGLVTALAGCTAPASGPTATAAATAPAAGVAKPADPPAVATPPVAAPPIATSPVTAPAVAAPFDTPDVEAARAHAAIVAARESDELLAGYADDLVCFEDVAPARREHVKKARVAAPNSDYVFVESRVAGRPPALRVVDPSTVLLVDRGVYTDDEQRPRIHERAVLLRKGAGVWQIAGETDLARAACLGVELGDLKPDPAVAACSKAAAACVKACPCKGASNSCEACKDLCAGDAVTCLGIAPGE